MKIATLLAFARPYRRALLLAGALMLLQSISVLLVPWLVGRFTAGLLLPEAVALELILLALLLLFALRAGLSMVNSRVMGETALHIGNDLRIRSYAHLQSLPIAFFHQHRQGDLLALLTREADTLASFISNTLLRIPTLLFTVSGAVVLMFLLDPMLAMLVTALVPLFYLLVKIVGRKLRPLSAAWQEEYAGSVAILDENLGMLPAIKAFTREAAEAERYRTQAGKVLTLGKQQVRIQALLGASLQFAAAAAVLLLLWLAGDRISAQTMTLPQLVSFLLYAALLTQPMASLAGVYGQIQATRGALERLERVMAASPEIRPGQGKVLAGVRGELCFRQVSFAYPGRAPVLDKLDLHIPAGQTVAIVGENGSGKSTLVQLLLRLYVPQEGQILLDEVDTGTLDLSFLRRQFALVSQQVLLFNGSIEANIAFANPAASSSDIESASRLAQLHEFVTTLPAGYATLIGDRGIRLSGGQQQRLALARALLKNAPVLILDEATAMFDPAGERNWIETCRQNLAPRTVILVTHRPATLALADRIYELRQGRLQEMTANGLVLQPG